jgi:hypothetical protein
MPQDREGEAARRQEGRTPKGRTVHARASHQTPRQHSRREEDHMSGRRTNRAKVSNQPPRRHAEVSTGHTHPGEVSHRRQLFVRTEAPLPAWALTENGARAMRILREAGIRLPNELTAQLHRDGLTNAFILSFDSPEAAQLVLDQAIRLRLFQPGQPESLKVQWKRPPRPSRQQPPARQAGGSPCPSSHYGPQRHRQSADHSSTPATSGRAGLRGGDTNNGSSTTAASSS